MVCFQKRKIHSIVMCTLSPWSEIRRGEKRRLKVNVVLILPVQNMETLRTESSMMEEGSK